MDCYARKAIREEASQSANGRVVRHIDKFFTYFE